MAAYALVLALGLVAGVVGGVIGTGSSIILLPALVFAFGAKAAVPIMAVAAVLANLGRVAAWRREVVWPAALAYALPAVPAAALGAATLVALPAGAVDAGIGVFFLAMIPIRRFLRARQLRLGLAGLAAAGAGVGYLTGVALSTGPLSVPAFAAFGLAKGALLATEAASSLAVYVAKVGVFGGLGALSADLAIKGAVVGATLIAGAYVGKAIVLRMSDALFQATLDLVMAAAGLALLAAAVREAF